MSELCVPFLYVEHQDRANLHFIGLEPLNDEIPVEGVVEDVAALAEQHELAVLLARAGVVTGRVLAADAEGARDVVLGDDEEGLDAEPEAGGRMVRRVRFRMDFPGCEKNCLEMSCRNSSRFAKD